MRRVVLDPNILVSALISPAGAPAQVIEAVLDAAIDHVASPRWLDEADGLAARPRFRRWFTQEDGAALIERLWLIAEVVPDPPETETYTRDPRDDYLVGLALQSGCDAIVSGDKDLLVLARQPQTITPGQLLDQLSTK